MINNEDQIARLIDEIGRKRQVFEDSSRELTQIEESIENLKTKNKDMRAVQFESEKRIKIITTNCQELMQ